MKRHILAAATALAILIVGAPIAGAAPATLDFSLQGQPMSGVSLGDQQGEKTCTGEGDAQVCTAPFGKQTTLKDTVPAIDNTTKANGAMSITCSIYLSGVTTTYATTTGTADATGSQDCTMVLQFPGGDAVFGSMHQTRVITGGTQTSTMDFIFTGGTGRYDGFFSKFQQVEKSDWPLPEPINSSKGKRQPVFRTADVVSALARAAGSQGSGGGQSGGGGDKGGGGSVKLKPKSKPLSNFATIGNLAPTNKPVVVKAASTPGAACTGTITGGGSIDLGKATANAKGTATFKALAAGAFAGPAGTKWSAKVTCKGSAGTSIGTAVLTSYEVLKK